MCSLHQALPNICFFSSVHFKYFWPWHWPPPRSTEKMCRPHSAVAGLTFEAEYSYKAPAAGTSTNTRYLSSYRPPECYFCRVLPSCQSQCTISLYSVEDRWPEVSGPLGLMVRTFSSPAHHSPQALWFKSWFLPLSCVLPVRNVVQAALPRRILLGRPRRDYYDLTTNESHRSLR